MKPTWIVIADSSRARIFEPESPSSPLREIEALTHPESRLHEQDLTADLPGRHNNDTGIGAHGFEERSEPKKQEMINFSRELANRLEAARNNREYEQLIVAAAPAFLGLLRDALSDATRELVRLEIDKNLARMNAEQIRKHLPEYLPSL